MWGRNGLFACLWELFEAGDAHASDPRLDQVEIVESIMSSESPVQFQGSVNLSSLFPRRRESFQLFEPVPDDYEFGWGDIFLARLDYQEPPVIGDIVVPPVITSRQIRPFK